MVNRRLSFDDGQEATAMPSPSPAAAAPPLPAASPEHEDLQQLSDAVIPEVPPSGSSDDGSSGRVRKRVKRSPVSSGGANADDVNVSSLPAVPLASVAAARSSLKYNKSVADMNLQRPVTVQMGLAESSDAAAKSVSKSSLVGKKRVKKRTGQAGRMRKAQVLNAEDDFTIGCTGGKVR